MAESNSSNRPASKPAGDLGKTTDPGTAGKTADPAVHAPLERTDEPQGVAGASQAASARRGAEEAQVFGDLPMSEGVRQDVLQDGEATDPLSGKRYTRDDLPAADRE